MGASEYIKEFAEYLKQGNNTVVANWRPSTWSSRLGDCIRYDLSYPHTLEIVEWEYDYPDVHFKCKDGGGWCYSPSNWDAFNFGEEETIEL